MQINIMLILCMIPTMLIIMDCVDHTDAADHSSHADHAVHAWWVGGWVGGMNSIRWRR